MTFMKLTRLCCILAIGSLVFAPSLFAQDAAQEKVADRQVKTVRLLTIGNSFSQNATKYLGKLVDSAGHKLIHHHPAVGGSTMQLHWDKAMRHEADPKDKAGLYSGGKSLKDELVAEPWDIITIQQASIRSHDVNTYRPYARQLHDYIKKHAPKSELVVHQTWAYRVDDPRFSVKSPKRGEPATQAEMYEGLSKAYRTIAAELGIRRIPVGDALYLADTNTDWGFRQDKSFDPKTAKHPALPDQTHSLHVGWKWSVAKDGKQALRIDGHHANTAGEYLGACVFYEFLYGESPVGNKYIAPGIDLEYAKFLQETAHAAVLNARKEPTPAKAASSSANDDMGVLVYGGTPGGIAAAIAAAEDGQRVVLVEPTARIGGLVTSGLSHTDFRTFEGLSGSYLHFARRVEQYYSAKYGPNSPQVEASFRGTFAEPKVNLLVFQQWLAEQPNITVKTGLQLAEVHVADGKKNVSTLDGLRKINSATFTDSAGQATTFKARVFIDGTYEGDLMAKAGVEWRVGREGRAEYNEKLAPEQADDQLQAYNFRFMMTRDPANRVTPVAPPGYRRDDFVDVLPVLDSGKIKNIFAYPKECIFKAQTPVLPGDKYDINDVSQGLVRLSLPGKNLAWPNGDAQSRERVFAEHLRDQVGLLFFLQNDSAVPPKFQSEAREWGWCRDEFTETNHLPPQLYVREARRMVGQYVFVEHDTSNADGDARAVLHTDAIAMGDYGNNCHGTSHEGPRFGGKHTGEFYKRIVPYQIPYGVIVPRGVNNLLVPVAASSSHVGFCALRLEPIWMSLGQAAGYAAARAATSDEFVQSVSVADLQRRLHAGGSATVYVTDIPPSHPDFAMVQWWGTAGGFHQLNPPLGNPRGKNLHGQYYEAFLNHAVDLDQPLDSNLAARWIKLAQDLGIDGDSLAGISAKSTRRAWLSAVWQSRKL